MMQTKYVEIQNLITRYGDVTAELLAASKWLSVRIVSEFPDFLGCEKKHVSGVPPVGEFNPNSNYRDACRSSYYERVSFLEPVDIGICTLIDNQHDEGATWVRSVVSVMQSGSTLVIHVGDAQRKVILSNQEDVDLTEVFDALYEDIRAAFEVELREALAQHRIGFVS